MIPTDELTPDDPRYGVDLGGISPSEVLTKAKILTEVPHAAIARYAARVQKTGILERLKEWRLEDGMDASLGGAPILINDLATLTGLMILAGEKKPLLYTELQELFQFRISEDSRRLLDLPDAATTFIGQLREESRWYKNARNACRYIMNLMNPYPYNLHESKNHVQIKYIMDRHDQQRAANCKARLDEFTERFLLMSFQTQPRRLRRISRTISVSFDQTFMESPNRKTYSRENLDKRALEEIKIGDQGKITPTAVDLANNYYVSSGGTRGDTPPGSKEQFDPVTANQSKKDANFQVGYALNLAMRVDGESPTSARFPLLAVSATLSTPNVGVSEEAVLLLQSAAKTGLKPGFAVADKQYFANAVFERLHDPVIALGFQPITSYRKDREYIAAAPGGAIYINDSVYCPATPKALQTAVKDNLNGIIDEDTLKKRLQERSAFRLTQKERPDSKGRVPMMCPALGPSPTVVCPLRELMKTAAKKVRPEVDETDIPAKLDRICRQHSVSFQESEIKRRSQGIEYGSTEWQKFHTYARNSIESLNAQIGQLGTTDLERASTRRARGITNAQIFATFRLVQENLEKIASFLKEEFKKELDIQVRSGAITERARDRLWRNAYTGHEPDELVPITPTHTPPQLE